MPTIASLSSSPIPGDVPLPGAAASGALAPCGLPKRRACELNKANASRSRPDPRLQLLPPKPKRERYSLLQESSVLQALNSDQLSGSLSPER
jgi:hypothetical protein